MVKKTQVGKETRKYTSYITDKFALKLADETLEKISDKIADGKISFPELKLFIQKRMRHNSKNILAGEDYDKHLEFIYHDVCVDLHDEHDLPLPDDAGEDGTITMPE